MIDLATPAYVTTFYSFKGGVGRTTLLVNVAHALAARGERVVIWDLDLEAPGVHHFPGLEPPERPWQSGFLEWLGETPLGDGDEPAADWPSGAWLRSLADRVYPAGGPAGARGTAAGKIFVLPAHGTDADVGRAYARVNWTALFVQRPWHSVHLFKRVRDELIARFDPSFILVDSRTGITDLGGLLTGFLPDCTVLVGNYGAQSLHGLRRVWGALDGFADAKQQDRLRREHRLERLRVASPVPVSPVARERGRARWSDGFPGVAPRSVVEVPLVENLLYAEDVLVRSAPSSDAARAYTEVASQLVGLRDARRPRPPAPRLSGETPTANALVVRVARLLRLLGFEVEDSGFVNGLRARDRRPLRGVELEVKCVSGAARLSDRWREHLVDARARARQSNRSPLIIVDRVGPGVRELAAAEGVELSAVGELEDQLVDLRPYLDALRRDFEDSGLARGYVEQRFVGAGARGGRDAIESTLAWLDERGPRLMLVVGDGGSGKSSFLRRLAYELVTRSSEEPELPSPLLIDLLDVAGISSLESVLQEHLRRTLGWHGNPEAILYLLEVGRLVLLFDGFDELSSTSSEVGAEEQLRVLSRPAEHGGVIPAANRVIISCRKSFVQSEDGSARAVSALAERLGAAVHELAPFEFDQIEQFLRNRLGAKAGAALGNLRQHQRAELSQTPLYLDLLAQNEEMLVTDPDEMSVTRLFERTAQGWLTSTLHGSLLEPAQREILIERLAAELWRLSDHELSLAIFAERLLAYRARSRELGVEQLDRELRSAPFLARSPAGTYRFSQRAFLEYFVASHLLRCADGRPDELRTALATERLSATCAALFAERVMQRGPDVQRAIAGHVRELATGSSAADVRDNATRLLAALGASK